MSQPLQQQAPTLSSLLQGCFARYPDRVAFRWPGGELSYRAVAERIGRTQAVFDAAGLQRGARIALLAGNDVDAWCAGMAALASGMATTWLHQLASLDDHRFQLEDFGAQVLVVDAGAFAQRAADLAAGSPRLTHCFTLRASDLGTDLAAARERVGHHGMRAVSRHEDVATINYTGGTTGRSKGAMRLQSGYAAMLMDVMTSFELPDRPQYLAAAPMTHVAGTLVPPTLLRGGTVHLMNGFAPDRLLHTVAEQRINLTLLVPTMIYTLLDHPELDRTDLSSLQSLIYGASPMSPTRLVEGLERIGPVFAQLYGQTEGYPVSFLKRSDHDARRPERFSSCGAPTFGSQVRLLDGDEQTVATGEVGELCVRGPQVMNGYLNQPELTAETLKGGWLHTGDMARADDEGYLYIVDRKKDMIVSGGFNVYPRDVEDAISSHPAVAMVAVIGTPDPKWGEAVTAVVTLRPGQTVDAEALKDIVRQKKGAVLTPKRLEFAADLPRTAVGKIDKKALRAPYWADQARQVG